MAEQSTLLLTLLLLSVVPGAFFPPDIRRENNVNILVDQTWIRVQGSRTIDSRWMERAREGRTKKRSKKRARQPERLQRFGWRVWNSMMMIVRVCMGLYECVGWRVAWRDVEWRRLVVEVLSDAKEEKTWPHGRYSLVEIFAAYYFAPLQLF